jgi:hypothetical protein
MVGADRVPIRDRILNYVKRQGVSGVDQETLRHINVDYEVESKQQTHYNILMGVLDELEEEGLIRREDLKVSMNKYVKMIYAKVNV